MLYHVTMRVICLLALPRTDKHQPLQIAPNCNDLDIHAFILETRCAHGRCTLSLFVDEFVPPLHTRSLLVSAYATG